jgi:eukaryotic-like serine/threonine-protein kinase
MVLVANDVYRIENIEISASQCRVSRDGAERHLRRQAFQVLLYLIQQHDRAVGREELIQSVWHGAAVTDDSLGQCISEIREALGDSSRNPRYIRTLPKIGYQFIAPVSGPVGVAEPSKAPAEGWRPQAESNAGALSATPSRSGTSSPNRRFPAAVFLVISAVVLAALAISPLLRRKSKPDFPTADATQSLVTPRRSIAVLGFRNLSGRPEDAWLSTAFSDWLSTELAAGEQLRIISPDTVAEKKSELQLASSADLSGASFNRLARQIGADLVLSGAYARLGRGADDLLRLDLRLQDTRTGDTVSAISESGNESRLFDLISHAGQTLRAKLAVPEVSRDQASQVAATLPSDPAAARVYAEGVEKLRASDFADARDLLEKAVAFAPNEPMPHAALAAAWEQLGYDGRAEAEARRAFDLSSHLSRADHLLIEARFQESSRDWDDAIRTFSALFNFFPDDLDFGLSLANAQVVGGKWREALETIAALRHLPAPLKDDPQIDWQEARAARSLGDMNRAISSAAQAAEKARAAGESSFEARALLEEARSMVSLQDSKRVISLVQTAEQLFAATQDQQGLASATNYLATLRQSQGDDQAARKGYEDALAIDQRIEYQPGIAAINNNLGGIDLGLGDTTGALQRYQEAAATYRRIGEQDGVALAEQGLGDVYLATANLKAAMANDQDSLEICRQTGDRSRGADALAGFSQVFWVEGDLNSAIDAVRQARASFEQLGDQSKFLHLDAELASILLDQGKASESVSVARTAAAAYSKLDYPADQVEIHLALANALLANHQFADARDAFENARRFSGSIHDRQLEWSIGITAARLEATSGKQGIAEAEKQLNDIAREAGAMSFVNTAFTARLELADLELHADNPALGRTQLQALHRESSEKGFELIAAKSAFGH